MNESLIPETKFPKSVFITGAIVVVFFATVAIIYMSFFSAPQNKTEPEQFTVAIGNNDSKEIAGQLKEQRFIRNEAVFRIILGDTGIESGAYKISKSMSAWRITKVFKQGPYMKWVTIPEGLRKEQIAEILARTLDWNEQEKSDWVTKYTAMEYDYFEGVYFPDTYLIPINESGLEIAQRFINKFNEKFAPYTDGFIQENIKWTTALKIASIVQREAAGKEDMPLIASIIWNRLLNDTKLEIDATLQYARDSQLAFEDLCHSSGNKEQWPCDCQQELENCYIKNGYYKGIEDWWTPIKVVDKQIDSEYNTYFYKGLPLRPIANPGIDAIEAVLNPAETNCFYYLHDNNKNTHCAETYEEHLENIEKWLK